MAAQAAIMVAVLTLVSLPLAYPGESSSAQSPAPCAHPFPEPPANSTTLSNGTQITSLASPVLLMSPGSTMSVCVLYRAPNFSTTANVYARSWTPNGDLPGPNASGVIVTASPARISISGGQSLVVEYTAKAGQDSTPGSYELWMTGGCVYVPFAITNGSAAVDSSDFPGFWTPCMSSGPAVFNRIIGYTAPSVTYLRNETRVNPEVNVTGISVSSFPTPQGAENVTFRMSVQSFSYPISVGLSLNESAVRVTDGNPLMTPGPAGDYCFWDGSNQTALSDMDSTTLTSLPASYMRIDAPVLQLGPYSNSTYSISLLISGPVARFTGLFLQYYTQAPGKPQGYSLLAADFPVAVSGQLQTISGSCNTGG